MLSHSTQISALQYKRSTPLGYLIRLVNTYHVEHSDNESVQVPVSLNLLSSLIRIKSGIGGNKLRKKFCIMGISFPLLLEESSGFLLAPETEKVLRRLSDERLQKIRINIRLLVERNSAFKDLCHKMSALLH